jgi:hypothetical protein
MSCLFFDSSTAQRQCGDVWHELSPSSAGLLWIVRNWLNNFLLSSQGGGLINTAYIERLNASFRHRLASLARCTRALARVPETLEWGMYLVGSVYNFCTRLRNASGLAGFSLSGQHLARMD